MPLPHSNPTTSRDAAHQAAQNAPRQRQLIWQYLAGRGREGATREELEAALRLSGNSVRPRVRELLQEQRIAELPLTRETKSGRQAHVLVALMSDNPDCGVAHLESDKWIHKDGKATCHVCGKFMGRIK